MKEIHYWGTASAFSYSLFQLWPFAEILGAGLHIVMCVLAWASRRGLRVALG